MSNWTPPDNDHPIVALGKEAIGAAVKASRLRHRWPQRWLAAQAGISQPVISRLESGRLNGIRWQTLARIVGVLQAGRGFRLPELLDFPMQPSRDDRHERDL